MKTQETAKIIIGRQSRLSQAIMPGELQEALAKRWIVPDTETGFLHVTSDFSTLETLRKLSEEQIKEEQSGAAPKVAVQESSAYPWEHGAYHESLVNHVHRREIQEIAPPGTGKPSPGFQAQPPAQPASPMAPVSTSVPTASNPSAGADIGDNVIVTEDGKTFTGVVQSKEPGGNYKLSFGNDKPRTQRAYAGAEMKLVNKAVANPAV